MEKSSTNKKKRITIVVLTTAIIITCFSLVGCKNAKNAFSESTTKDFRDMSYRKYGYSDIDIASYGEILVLKKLRAVGITSSEKIGLNQYRLDASEEDFKKLGKLSTDDIYSLEVVIDAASMEKVLSVNGYADIDDFLIKNNFVDSDGKPSRAAWFYSHMNHIAKIMHDEEEKSKK